MRHQSSAAAPDGPNCRKSPLKSKKVKAAAVKRRGNRAKVKKEENTGAAQSIDNDENLATNSQNGENTVQFDTVIEFSPDGQNVIGTTQNGQYVIPIKQNDEDVIPIAKNGVCYVNSDTIGEIVNSSTTGNQNSECVIPVSHNRENVIQIHSYPESVVENGENVIMDTTNAENDAGPTMSDEEAVWVSGAVEESGNSVELTDESRWVRGRAGGYPLPGVK
jgi:hypothetical protein